jgi:hypothetical protein
MNQTEQLKLVRTAFDRLEFLNDLTWTPYRERHLAMCIEEEKGHRGFGCDFRKHHPNAVGIKDAARSFVVKRIAEYLSGEAPPKGKDFLHIQRSCFYAAALVDEYGTKIREKWAGLDLAALSSLDYCVLVSPEDKAA